MKILIFDDDAEHREGFLKDSDQKPVFVSTAQEAIARLRDEDWDAAFLAHSLSKSPFMEANDPASGTAVAKWLSKNPRRVPKLVVLHDPYDLGRERMKKVLPSAMSFSHAWQTPLGMLVKRPERDGYSTPLYYPLED